MGYNFVEITATSVWDKVEAGSKLTIVVLASYGNYTASVFTTDDVRIGDLQNLITMTDRVKFFENVPTTQEGA